jgi:RNA polymerase primary sigma factor
MTDDVGFYVKLIEQFPLLSRDEEVSLAEKIQKTNCEVSKERMVNSNLKLVLKIAHEQKNKGVGLMDLIQEGNRGLIKAVTKYRLDKGSKFSTYASWWIRQGMTRYIENNQTAVNIPCKTRQNIYKMREAISRLTETLHRDPSIVEIAKEIGQSEMTVKHLLPVYQYNETNLDSNPKDDEDKTCNGEMFIYEWLKGEGTFTHDLEVNDQFKAVKAILEKHFSFDKQLIIMMRFGLLEDQKTRSLQEIAEDFEISRERVRQIIEDVMFTLRILIFKEML